MGQPAKKVAAPTRQTASKDPPKPSFLDDSDEESFYEKRPATQTQKPVGQTIGKKPSILDSDEDED